jgi:hypothetical protein
LKVDFEPYPEPFRLRARGGVLKELIAEPTRNEKTYQCVFLSNFGVRGQAL